MKYPLEYVVAVYVCPLIFIVTVWSFIPVLFVSSFPLIFIVVPLVAGLRSYISIFVGNLLTSNVAFANDSL